MRGPTGSTRTRRSCRIPSARGCRARSSGRPAAQSPARPGQQPRGSRRQLDVPERADPRPVTAGLVGWLQPGRWSSGSRSPWRAAGGVRGEVPAKCRRGCRFSSGLGCGGRWKGLREEGGCGARGWSHHRPRVVPAGAQDLTAEASEVPRWGRSLRGAHFSTRGDSASHRTCGSVWRHFQCHG